MLFSKVHLCYFVFPLHLKRNTWYFSSRYVFTLPNLRHFLHLQMRLTLRAPAASQGAREAIRKCRGHVSLGHHGLVRDRRWEDVRRTFSTCSQAQTCHDVHMTCPAGSGECWCSALSPALCLGGTEKAR